MVPSICPLETLHNSLSLKQVDEFLTSIPESERSSGIPTTSSGRITISFFDCVNLQCLEDNYIRLNNGNVINHQLSVSSSFP